MKTVLWELSCSMRTDGRKDVHTEANCSFLQFCERVQKPLKKQNPSHDNTLYFSEESELKWKYFYKNDRTVSTKQ
jgi:hypothetical protein